MKTLLRILLVLSLSLTPLLASFENTQRSLLPANTNSRAPRQGLVFDGTNTSTISTAVPAFGTADFSVSTWLYTDLTVNVQGFIGSTAVGGIGFYTLTDGTIGRQKLGTGGDSTPAGVISANKWSLFTYTRASGVATFYVNGLSVYSVADTFNYTQTISMLGGFAGGYNYKGTVAPLIYNRALSASEVVALYEAGAPAGADYNSASNTALNGAAFTNGNFTTFTSASATGFTATNTSGSEKYAQSNNTFAVTLGQRIRVTYSLSGTGTVSAKLAETGVQNLSSPQTLTAGTSQQVTFVVTTASANCVLHVTSAGSTDNFTLSSVKIDRPGLLLAPDAAQAGGGLVWYDTSGNAANISWTSGVSWNVPTSGNMAGNLQVNGTGNNVFRGPIRWGNTSWPGYNGYISEASTDSGLFPAITRNLIGSTGSNYTIANGQLGEYSGFQLGTDIRWFLGSGTFTTGQSLVPTERMRLTYLGNLLLGTTTDVGAKVYSKVADGVLSFGAAGTTKGIRFAHASTYSTIDGVDSSLSGSYQPLQINGSTVQIATNGGTVAASFDTSQNATFANGLVAGKTLSVNSITGGDAGAGTSIISFKDGLGATKVNITGDGKVVLSNTAASTSTTTGALTVSGGVGIAGALNAGGNVTASDVILGTSGPSVKSSLSARAPRQGLVFDGTAGVSVSTPALGTADFSISFFVRRDSSSVQQYLIGNDNVGCFYVGFRTTGALYSGKAAGSANGDLNIGNVVGKWQHIVLVRSGGNITGYADGVSVGSVTDVGSNYTTGAYSLFQASAGAAALVGAAMSPYFYNRALSASEVVSLYESGAPSGADYATPAATNTNQITGDAWWDTKTGSVSSGTITLTSGQYVLRGAVLTKGKRYRTTYNVTALTGTVQVGNTSAAPTVVQNVSLGAGSFEFTAADNGAFGFNASSGTATINNVTFIPVGLLLAHDAAQAGGGLTWYDTSGNAANITLPASGVMWNVPTSGTVNGPLTIRNTSAYLKLNSTGANKTWDVFADNGGSFFVAQSGVLNALQIAPTTGNATLAGNLTVNSTTDASSAPTGSIYTAGGIAVGTNKKFMATGTGGYWGAAAASTLDTLLIRATGFGYSPTSYAGVQIGGTAGRSIIFGVDVSAIAGGQFSGASNEWIIPNTLNIRQVTSDNTNFSNAIFTIGNGGATTIGGNLTVSGTGTSSFASGSKLGVGTTSPGVTFVAAGAPATLNYTIGQTSLADIRSTSAATTNDGPSLTFSGYYQTSLNTSTYGAIKGVLLGAGDGNSAAGALAFLTANTGGVLSEQARLTNLGNFIIGSPFTDAGYKLQVNGTAIISGLIVSNSATDQKMSFVAAANATYGGANYLRWYRADGTTTRAFFGFGSGNSQVFNLGTEESGDSLQFSTGTNTTALTLDSAQNATFAKKITTLGTADNSFAGRLLVSAGSNNSQEGIIRLTSTDTEQFANIGFFNGATSKNANARNWQISTNYNAFGTLEFLRSTTNTGNPTTLVLTLDKDGDATFAGSIRQNQANNISLTSGVATTIFSLGTSAGVYIVTATLDVNSNAGYAIVGKGATGSWQVLANSGSQISFSMSTNDLQITQSSGATSTTNTFNLLRLR